MKFKDTLYLCYKELLKKKYNILIIIITIMLMTMLLFYSSFNNGLNNYWKSCMEKNIEYRTFFVYSNNFESNENEIIKKLNNYKHVIAVEPYASKSIVCKVNNIKDSAKSNVTLVGTIDDPIKIIKGTNFEGYENENVIICPKEFYPYTHDDKNFKEENIINLENKIGSNIVLSPVDSKDKVSFKLVGIYDSALSNTIGDFCYTKFSSVNELNNKYLSEVYEDTEYTQSPVIVVLDSVKHSQEFENKLDKGGFISGGPIKRVNVTDGEKIINVLLFISIIIGILYVFLCISLNCKEYINNKGQYGILKTIGYSENTITNVFLISQIIVLIISIIISIINYCLFKNVFTRLFLDKLILKGIKLNLDVNSIVYCLLIGSVLLLIFKISFNAKIKKESAINLLKEN